MSELKNYCNFPLCLLCNIDERKFATDIRTYLCSQTMYKASQQLEKANPCNLIRIL
jgi:hypothetical protein